MSSHSGSNCLNHLPVCILSSLRVPFSFQARRSPGKHPYRSSVLRLSGLAIALGLLLLSSAVAESHAETLQSVFDAAAAGFGYDRYVELDPGVTLTGGLTIPVGTRACIKGNGAILDLQTQMIQIQGKGTLLDIDHCVLMNGGDPAYGLAQGALNFVGGEGNIISNTFVWNTVAVRIYSTSPSLVAVKNNIMALNSQAGLLCQLYHEPQVLYNDCWGNVIDNYLQDCG
jgi:hypothetical protein